MADESLTMASGDVPWSAIAKAVRETDAELWAKFEQIEEECAGEDEDTTRAAHQAAGTFIVMIRLALAGLEAEGKIYRTGELKNGRPVFARALKHSANECERAAARIADPQIQASYREMSRQWHEMAERQLGIDQALSRGGTI